MHAVCEGCLFTDALFRHQAQQACVHGTHTLCRTRLNSGIDLVRLCLTDQVFDGRVRIHDLKRRGLLAVQRGNKLLADDRLKHHGELHAHLRLLPGREHVDDAVHRVGSARGVPTC